MSFTPQQLVLAITLALGATSLQLAQAQPSPALPEPSIDFAFTGQATSRNGLRAAQVLDSAVDALLKSDELSDWDRYEIGQIGDYLHSLEPGRVGAVLEQLAGSQNANLGTATQKSMEQISNGLLSVMREQAKGSVEDSTRVWAMGMNNGGRLAGQQGSAGLQRDTRGVLFGADWAAGPEWRIGLMGGKSDSTFDAKRFHAELDSWHLGSYAVRQDGPLALRLGAIYSSHDGQNKRNIDIDFFDYREQLKGKYNAQSQSAFAELGYQVSKGDFTAEPFAGVGYQRYHRDSFKENGGLAALNVGEQTQKNLSSTFGVRLASLHRLDNQMSLKPYLATSWKHLYGNVDSKVRQSSRLVDKKDFNSDFTIEGTALDRDSLALQAGVDWGLSAQQTISLAYTSDIGSDSRNHGVMGQWQMGF
ncbi:outer membrane autotransporter barrel domain-containing protein [Pseudomonas grimontii]|uniref:Autotransporter outer membrane beta-barrel domain-containing protein n=1 Tax=Pseudomonas grimontii TaxID=129847 RepID=A0A1H1DPS0_9PSED|nr:autotransporter outer membrane beta-barrel domain-containing protein [Pseudomonas grimontii]TWR68340.1 autotransporter outer membrane beta-barrel domain-containing protein [Pseudomonas grimontii]SDQ78279.1 outer membrane autotransporter barrel domain-containing protein [Pseudomonas grimontii]